jgi:Zn-dependent peptidase ImmA (M78 family)
MPRKYEDPKKAAKEAAWIDKSNYLAHTIRSLEYSISRVRRKPFVIVVRKGCRKTKADFHDSKSYCDIFLADATEQMDDKSFRLILAHELGHVFYNFDSLKEVGFSFDSEHTHIEEEVYAWVFAYWLIFEKSERFKSRDGDKCFIYEGNELKQALLTLIRDSGVENAKEICDHVKKQLK